MLTNERSIDHEYLIFILCLLVRCVTPLMNESVSTACTSMAPYPQSALCGTPTPRSRPRQKSSQRPHQLNAKETFTETIVCLFIEGAKRPILMKPHKKLVKESIPHSASESSRSSSSSIHMYVVWNTRVAAQRHRYPLVARRVARSGSDSSSHASRLLFTSACS